MLSKEIKSEIIKNNAQSDNDTGSSQVQIALISKRIEQISAHLKKFPKDSHSHRGLIKLLGQRRSLTKYLERTSK